MENPGGPNAEPQAEMYFIPEREVEEWQANLAIASTVGFDTSERSVDFFKSEEVCREILAQWGHYIYSVEVVTKRGVHKGFAAILFHSDGVILLSKPEQSPAIAIAEMLYFISLSHS